MTKQAFMVFHRDYHDFLAQLGQLGVLHVIERDNPEKEESLSGIRARIERIDQALTVIAGARAEAKSLGGEIDHYPAPEQSTDQILEEIETLRNKQQWIMSAIDETGLMIERQEPWGDYSVEDLERLENSGYRVYLFKSSLHNFETVSREDYFIFEIHRSATYIWFMVVAPAESLVEIDAEREMPARNSLSELREKRHRHEQELNTTMNELAEMGAVFEEKLSEEKRKLESDLILRKVYFDTISETGDTLRILEGWVPEEHLAKVRALAENVGAVIIETTPAEGELPPVQLRNSRFTRLFEPITRLFDLPKYSELDLTPYFAPFFMLFFGFCLGDAGYGIVFILLGTIFKFILGKDHKLRPILTLGQYFGVATIILGLVSGTFFGMNLVDSGYTLTADSFSQMEKKDVPAGITGPLLQLEGEYFHSRSEFTSAVEKVLGDASPRYRKIVLKSAEAGLPVIRKFRHLMQDPLSMFYLSLLIGAVQIMFGIFVRILNIKHRRGTRYILAPLGWLLLIVTLSLYAAGLFTGVVVRWFFYGLLGVSGLFIFVLNRPGEGLFTRIGSGIWDSYSTVTGIFGDLLSYIRLFALGISSAILGFVFNDISLQMLNIRFVGWLLFLVILLAGHTINIFLATLGAFVHPMRLTFVEFYKNAGFEGGGKAYRPFRIEGERRA